MGSTPAATAGAAAAKPTIISRAQWGADESLRTCAPDYVDKLKGAIVHHTVNSNTYSADDVPPASLRGIYAYHVNGNGWCDVGYNFFVDRFGRLFEGRFGGDYKNVVGAQATGLQRAVLRRLLARQPRPRHLRAPSRPSSAVLTRHRQARSAWKAWLNGWDPDDLGELHLGGQLASGRGGTVVTKPRVSGHRDFNLTDLPR